MGLLLPNTNATVWSCACILSFLLVPLLVVVINCGDAKCIVIASVVLIECRQTTSSFHSNESTLLFDVRTQNTEASTFNARLLITIINDIVAIDDDASNATVQPWVRVFSHLLDQIFTSSHDGAYGSPVLFFALCFL